MTDEGKKKWAVLGIGIAVYVSAVVLSIRYQMRGTLEFVLFVWAYLLIGFSVFRRIVVNIEQRQFFNENILIVLATAGAMGVGRYMEADAVLLLFALAGIAEDRTVRRSKKFIQDFIDIRPVKATRKVRGKEVEVDPSELKLRNIVVVKPGERVPIDGVVTAGATTLDTQALTGETIPQAVGAGDKIYSGSINLTGAVELRVTKTYEDSTVSRIMDMVEEAGQEKVKQITPVKRFMWIYTPIVTAAAFLIAVLPPLSFAWGRWHEWIYRGLVFLIAACPCGLVISEPLAYLGGIAAAAKHGVIVKGGHFLELLTQSDIFIFDKTGTLTEGVFAVTEVHPAGGIEEDELLRMAAYAECYSNHPIAKSLQEAYQKPIDKKLIKSVKELAGYGVSSTVEGKRVHIGNRRMAEKQKVEYAHVESAGTVLHAVIDKAYAGYIVAEDVIKEEAYSTMEWLQKKFHAVIVMLTGDRVAAARQVAWELDMDYAYANLLPEEKLMHLKEFKQLQGDREKVVFVGDGINDALVLTEADIGIAMGAFGSDAAIEAADIVLMEDDISKIIDIIKLAKETVQVVKSNLVLALLVKAVVLLLCIPGYMGLWTALAADLAVMFASLLNAVSIVKYPVD